MIKFVSDLRQVGGKPVSSINKTYHQDINEILLKVELNTIKQTKTLVKYFDYVLLYVYTFYSFKINVCFSCYQTASRTGKSSLAIVKMNLKYNMELNMYRSLPKV